MAAATVLEMPKKAFKAVRVLLNAVYINGVTLFKDVQLAADSQLSASKDNPGVKIVTLRFAMPAGQADMLDKAFRSGIVELNIEGVQTLLSGNETR